MFQFAIPSIFHVTFYKNICLSSWKTSLKYVTLSQSLASRIYITVNTHSTFRLVREQEDRPPQGNSTLASALLLVRRGSQGSARRCPVQGSVVSGGHGLVPGISCLLFQPLCPSVPGAKYTEQPYTPGTARPVTLYLLVCFLLLHNSYHRAGYITVLCPF